MESNVSRAEYEEIGEMIHDASSPVGIDAKKTHIIIIHKLIALERRLDHLEQRITRQ